MRVGRSRLFSWFNKKFNTLTMKKPAKLLSVNAYAKLRGIDQKNMRTTLAKVGWSGKVDIEKVDKLIAEAKSARYQKGAPAKGGKVPFAEAERRERLAKAIQDRKSTR